MKTRKQAILLGAIKTRNRITIGFWFCIWLVKKVVQVFLTSREALRSKTNEIPDHFPQEIENFLTL